LTRLFLIRHGRTAWNAVERYRGREDLPLDEVGQLQAKALADGFAAVRLAAVYSSPLQRAWHIAQAIAATQGLDVRLHDGLLDIDYGQWQGLSPEEARARFPQLFRDWEEQPQKVRFPGGEGLAEVRERAVAALEDVARRHSGASVALVSHRVVCQVMMCAMLGLDDSRFWQLVPDVASVQTLEHDGERFRVTSFNDTCHLRSFQ